MSITDSQIMITRLGELKRPFTVVSAYLQCPDKNPIAFIEILDKALAEQKLSSDGSEALIQALAKIWTDCVEQDPSLQTAGSAPHIFLCAIHQQPELWNAPLKIGSAPASRL
ncbi:MAG TPA: hypothetical protein PLF01_06515 [Alphaproteobacteria bacterium]|nr:hypothetical protein [Alphaproteobacteria bacterium]